MKLHCNTIFSPGLLTNTKELKEKTAPRKRWKINIWRVWFKHNDVMNGLVLVSEFLELLNYVSVTGKNAPKNMLTSPPFFPISDLTSRSWFCWINFLFRPISQINLVAHPQVLSCKDLLFEIPAVLFRFDRLQQTHGMCLFPGGRL